MAKREQESENLGAGSDSRGDLRLCGRCNQTWWSADGHVCPDGAIQESEGQRRWDEADRMAKLAAKHPVGGTTFPVCYVCGRAYDPDFRHMCPRLDEPERPPATPPGVTQREAVMVSIGEAKHGGYYVASAATETRRAEILFTGSLDETLAFIRGHMEEAGAPMAMAQ